MSRNAVWMETSWEESKRLMFKGVVDRDDDGDDEEDEEDEVEDTAGTVHASGGKPKKKKKAKGKSKGAPKKKVCAHASTTFSLR